MNTTTGTVEIAGGGIAGLGAAILFAQRGWRVRVHERNEAIREVGAGIYLRNNPIKVLEVMGIADELEAHSLVLTRGLYRDATGTVLQDMDLGGPRRMWMTPRHVLIQTLEAKARAEGVEIAVGSSVAGATGAGELVMTSGERITADLVIGADGQRSRVRNSLGLTRKRKELDSVATRFILPTREFEPNPWTTMYWSGNRRIGVAACGDDQTYVFMISTKQDTVGNRQPIDVASWSASFPVLAPMLAAMADAPSIQHPFVLVRSKKWSSGRVAIIGDAAHGLPPLLGQGAGLALSNAWSLADVVSRRGTADMAATLEKWEKDFRRFSDITQNWSVGLDVMTRLWPRPLLPLRQRALIAIGRSAVLQRSQRAAEAFPIEHRRSA